MIALQTVFYRKKPKTEKKGDNRQIEIDWLSRAAHFCAICADCAVCADCADYVVCAICVHICAVCVHVYAVLFVLAHKLFWISKTQLFVLFRVSSRCHLGIRY